MLAIMRGDADAEAQALSTFELGTAAGQPDAAEVFAAQLSSIRHNDGRVAEFVDALRTSAHANPHVPAPRAARARFYCDLDRHAEAREQIDLFRRGPGDERAPRRAPLSRPHPARLGRDAPRPQRPRARELIAAGRAAAEQLGVAREIVRFERLRERLEGRAVVRS